MKEERTGADFNLSLYLKAREKAWTHLYQIAELVKENSKETNEAQIHQAIKEHFPEGTKFWHPSKVRFAENTTCTFRAPSKEGVSLTNDETFFLDIGPVIDGHEADVGQTFSLSDPNFINPAQEIFNQLEVFWQVEKMTGEALYKKGHELAQSMGLELNEDMHGHRLGDFPHALIHRGGLNEFSNAPKEMLWVLEIHVLNPKTKRGFFFEDILGAPKLSILGH